MFQALDLLLYLGYFFFSSKEMVWSIALSLFSEEETEATGVLGGCPVSGSGWESEGHETQPQRPQAGQESGQWEAS